MMMRETVDAGPVAPRAAFGTGAGPAPADALTDMAFKRGAAAGNELVDLGALLSNPKIRAMIGLGGAGAFAAGMAGMMGDLAESLVKRDLGAKDSGSILGGMGGFLDLADSLLLAGPVAWLLWALG